ncbi:MAG TPA: ABC-type transport auxiliary lipoprotein family protein [Xanthomonadaceae bacterium]|nr:ABC-type transport auxiliary lipoprotein family protein [Xanthomonadaceae bacterium]
MSAPRHLVRNAIASIVLLLPLIGCGSLLPKSEPQEIITSQVHVDPDPAWPQVGWQLTVAQPSASDILDSRRMAVIPSPGRIEVYKGVAWDDTVPNIVQDTVVHAFEDSGKILAVGHQTAGLHTDYLLMLELRDDQAVYRTPSAPPEVTLVVNAKLIDFASSRAVASRTFRETVPATGTAVPAVAQAFDSALGAFVHELVGWTLDSGQQARAEAGKARK